MGKYWFHPGMGEMVFMEVNMLWDVISWLGLEGKEKIIEKSRKLVEKRRKLVEKSTASWKINTIITF